MRKSLALFICSVKQGFFMTLSIIEHNPSGSVNYSVICLHGLGASGYDLAPLAQTFDLPGVRFVFPTAPAIPITMNQGMEMPAWYDIKSLDFNSRAHLPDLNDSIAAVHALIADEQSKQGIAPENIFIMGFSQGGAMALEVGLHYSQKLAGIISLSAYAPRADKSFENLSSANSGTPIFQAHGKQDSVVPLAAGEFAKDKLLALGYSPDWHTYDMAHEISISEVTDIKQWFLKRV
jgi:phospholipase/carboxylesterase